MYLAIAGQTDGRARSSRAPQVNRLGWTPLHYAASKASWRWRNCCCSTRPWSTRPPSGETPLMMAALSGSKPMVELLQGRRRRHHAPTVQAQQPVAPGGAGAPAVRGVSGVQLNSYE